MAQKDQQNRTRNQNPKTKQSSKSWQGRLTSDTDEVTARFVASLDIDHALWRYDIAGSVVHARMLWEVGVLKKTEYSAIKTGLVKVAGMIEDDSLDMPIELEDIHMVIEKALIDTIGDVGGKLHTGRSRNDQVALDMRLWARDATDQLIDGIRKLQQAFVTLAQRDGKIIIPAYTHLQRAQPIVAGHGMLAYVEMLDRDANRLIDGRKRIDICPLGSGAVAGTSIAIDRKRTAKLLGFSSVARNSIDATSDRDFLTELCFCCAMLSIHLSRWAEDWIIYSTTEFDLIKLDDAYCTSSSMMPQKKNADTLELIRGKTGTAMGQLMGMMTALKGLPLAYNRDLQDDKRYAFASFDAMDQSLAVAAGIVATAKINERAAGANIDAGFLDATSLAEYLVNKQIPFRQAHGIVGRLVAKAEAAGLALAELPLATLQKSSPAFEKDVSGHLTAANVVKRYASDGAGGQKQLTKQLRYWTKKLWD